MEHRGPRLAGTEYFDDIMGEGRGPTGILTGLGEAQYDQIGEQISSDGLEVTMSCRQCGRGAKVTLEWPELVMCGMNQSQPGVWIPAGWQRSNENGTLYPAVVKCGKCNHPLCPHVTPDECRKHVNDACRAGLLDPRAVQAWQAQFQQAAVAQQQQGYR